MSFLLNKDIISIHVKYFTQMHQVDISLFFVRYFFNISRYAENHSSLFTATFTASRAPLTSFSYSEIVLRFLSISLDSSSHLKFSIVLRGRVASFCVPIHVCWGNNSLFEPQNRALIRLSSVERTSCVQVGTHSSEKSCVYHSF